MESYDGNLVYLMCYAQVRELRQHPTRPTLRLYGAPWTPKKGLKAVTTRLERGREGKKVRRKREEGEGERGKDRNL